MNKILNYTEYIIEQTENFSLEFLNSLKSFVDRKKYCDKFFKKLGSGSSRITYDYSDNTVLKLALNKKGIEQNNAEDDWYIQKFDFITKIIENDKNYFWIISQKAEKCTTKKFKELCDIDFDDFIKYLKQYQYEQYPKKFTFNKNIKVSDEVLEKITSSELFQDFFEYIMSYDLLDLIMEFSNIKNWGILNNNLVIIDYGLNNQIYNDFYKK